MLHVTNLITINVNNTGNGLKTGAVNDPENTSHSIKRGIESCKTETAGYSSLDIEFIIEFRTESIQNCVWKFGCLSNLVFRNVRYSVNGAYNSFISAIIRI